MRRNCSHPGPGSLLLRRGSRWPRNYPHCCQSLAGPAALALERGLGQGAAGLTGSCWAACAGIAHCRLLLAAGKGGYSEQQGGGSRGYGRRWHVGQLLSTESASEAIALRGAQVGRRHAGRIDDQLFEDYPWIDHPEV
jgi:hypothetical protein